VRPSGNAPQLRIYAVAGDEARAEDIVALALAEPDGLLRRLLAAAP
jgi:phosphomannomutase